MNEKIPTIRPTAVFGLEQARIGLGLAKNCRWATNADNSVTTTSFTVQGTDVASTVAADQGSVTPPEGAAVSNTGTFSDVDDAVTISASVGTVTQDNTQGTWSWSGTAPDEASPYTVTIMATNADKSVTTKVIPVRVKVWLAHVVSGQIRRLVKGSIQ